MSMQLFEKSEKSFRETSEAVLRKIGSKEHLTLQLAGEKSAFIRFNGAKVRQTGEVTDAVLELNLVTDGKSVTANLPFRCDGKIDQSECEARLNDMRGIAKSLPEDPYAVIPKQEKSIASNSTGRLLSANELTEKLMEPMSAYDATGIYAGGPSYRAVSNSAGLFHWFGTETFYVNYSLYTPSEKSVKLNYAGQNWDDSVFKKQIENGGKMLRHLDKAPRKIERGKYRTYLAPGAVNELLDMFSWYGVSEGSLRRGESALLQLREGKKALSPKFTLRENFSLGHTPRFNEFGEVAPEKVNIIENGKFVGSLVSARTAKEFGVQSNAAASHEGMRSAEVLPGDLSEADVLRKLNTGLYLSNLHYLNWSDVSGARVTGMTRYACFWVENGEIVAPIQDLRFDESLFHIFGAGLESITKEVEFTPNTSTYSERSLGGTLCPGVLVDDFTFTL